MKNLIYILIAVMIVTLAIGCSKKSKKMFGAQKNEHGLAMPQRQIDKEIRGKDIINITDAMKYPGMEQYSNAKYDYTSEDPPEKVAEWFLANLKGSTDRKQGDGSELIIIYKETIINIIPYGDGGSLLRYKANI